MRPAADHGHCGAKSDLRVLRLKRKAIMDLLHEFPDIALEFIKVIAARLERSNRDLADEREGA